jgi:hypothetical protein
MAAIIGGGVAATRARGKPHGRSVGRYTPPAQIPLSRGARVPTSWLKTRAARSAAARGTTMLFTILCSFSTGLTIFCILNRVHKRAIELAVKLAVREVEKEYEGRTGAMKAQLARKEEELKKVQDKVGQLVKLHSAVPSLTRSRTAGGRGQAAAEGNGAGEEGKAEERGPRGLRDDAAVHRHVVRRAAAHDQRREDRSVGQLAAARTAARHGRGSANSAAAFSQPIRSATGAGSSPSQRRACRISAS